MIPSASSFRASTVFSQYQMVFQLKRQQAFERTHLRIFCESQQVAFLVLQFLVLAHTWFIDRSSRSVSGHLPIQPLHEFPPRVWSASHSCPWDPVLSVVAQVLSDQFAKSRQCFCGVPDHLTKVLLFSFSTKSVAYFCFSLSFSTASFLISCT